MADPRISDFSLGETDFYRDGNPRFHRTMKNLYVSENRRAISRPGYDTLFSDDVDPFGYQAINKIWTHVTSRAAVLSTSIDEREIFIQSNLAFRVHKSPGGLWRTPGQVGGNSTAQIQSILRQGNYIRLSDNEFILTQEYDGTHGYPIKFFREGVNQEWKYVTLGLPKYKLNPTSGFSIAVAGANNWAYALVLKYEYTTNEFGTGNITRIVRSEPIYTDIITNADSLNIVFPTFTGSVGDMVNYVDNDGVAVSTFASFPFIDVGAPGECVWELYRTTSNGTVFYKIYEGPFGFADNLADSAITSGELLYTIGGVFPNQMPNGRTFCGTFANDAVWLASTSRVWQHKVGIPDAANGSFVFSSPQGEEIRGLNKIDIYPILFTSLGGYRIEGIVDDLGNGTHRVRVIPGSVGAISNKTIVEAYDKIYYLAEDGIYYTNGYTAAKVSNHYNDRYAELINRRHSFSQRSGRVAKGVFDGINKRVHWFFCEEGGSGLRETLTIDLKYAHEDGISIQSGTVPYNVLDATCNAGMIQIVTDTGAVLSQDKENLNDRDTEGDTGGINGNTYNEKTGIPWVLETGVLSFGSDIMRKWFQKVLIHLTRRTSDLSFRVLSDTDESNDWREHNPIRERGFTRGLFFLKRWFTKGRIRGTYKAIRFTNEDYVFSISDDHDLATVSGVVVSVNSGTFGHFDNPVGLPMGYFITFDVDNYTARYRIRQPSAPDPTVLSLQTAPPAGVHKWKIIGVPQDEAVEFNGYTIQYAPSGEGHTESQPVGTTNG